MKRFLVQNIFCGNTSLDVIIDVTNEECEFVKVEIVDYKTNIHGNIMLNFYNITAEEGINQHEKLVEYTLKDKFKFLHSNDFRILNKIELEDRSDKIENFLQK